MDEISTSIKDRILQIADIKGISKEKFIENLNQKYSNYRGVSKKSAPSAEVIAEISTKYPDVSIEWVLTGRGQKLRTTMQDNHSLEPKNWIVENEKSEHDSPKHSKESLERVGLRIDEIARLLKMDPQDIADAIGFDRIDFMQIITGMKPAPSKLLDDIAEYFPEIDKTWLYTGHGQPINENRSIPLIPVDAMAGFGSGVATQVMTYDMERYIIPEFTELGVEFLIRVKGNSMQPKYNSGDVLGCRRLTMDTFFQWGKVYVLDTTQGGLVKRVFKSETPGYIKCVSDNESYPPFDLEFDKHINAIGLVCGVIRLE
ncbi:MULTISPECIES: S24 family peptidase [Sphingobacterium]|uniref:S24 family peptidase n=1 Tax=Sphingobacterium TaxID=28453 RepID=UPI00257EDFAD|nr:MULTISPECIES: S24 family peptidase [Sphingobacterium]